MGNIQLSQINRANGNHLVPNIVVMTIVLMSNPKHPGPLALSAAPVAQAQSTCQRLREAKTSHFQQMVFWSSLEQGQSSLCIGAAKV